MRIVIDIPDYDIKQIKEYYEGHDIVESTYSYIYHGQTLSEILDKISAEIEEAQEKCSHPLGIEKALEIVEKYKGVS